MTIYKLPSGSFSTNVILNGILTGNVQFNVVAGNTITFNNITGNVTNFTAANLYISNVLTNNFITTNFTSIAGTASNLSINNQLVIPAGTSAQRPSVAANGMLRYNTTTGAYEGFNAGQWGTIGGAAGAKGGANDQLFWENGTTMTASYTITSNTNAMTAGPITINDGVVVTVPDGSTWTIV